MWRELPALHLDDRLAVLAGSYAWLAAKDGGRYEEAWALLSDRMKGASPLVQWRAAAERFNDRAGPVRGRQVTRISFYRDPPDAPEPGLYAAADFSAGVSAGSPPASFSTSACTAVHRSFSCRVGSHGAGESRPRAS